MQGAGTEGFRKVRQGSDKYLQTDADAEGSYHQFVGKVLHAE